MHNAGKPLGGHMRAAGTVTVAILVFSLSFASADQPQEALDESDFELGPSEFVQYGGVDITVAGYSVPSSFDWNSDGLLDLIVGEGGGATLGRVRVYPNVGNNTEPVFGTYFFAQSGGADLTVPASGCLGAFPRVVYWDNDGRKDLLVGRADGKVQLFFNTGVDQDPVFDGGRFLQVGPPGAKVDISVGSRATSIVVDWNNDGRKDLVVGAYDGYVRIFLNEGTDTEPDFRTESFALSFGQPLVVDTLRSSPTMADVTADGRKDLVLGDTEGRLLLYANTGSDHDPSFRGAVAVTSDGAPIDLDSTRSRPSLCDWNSDGLIDVLLGSSDGRIRIYRNARGVFTDGFDSGDTSHWSSAMP